MAGLAGLGAWQVHRRAWKLDLIARVEARVHAEPISAPGSERWAGLSAAADEYRRVTATGTWRPERSALVQAVTERGGGYWVLTGLARDDGTTVLVNRGFVPPEKREPAAWPPLRAGRITVTGLLRLSEPGGAFLRSNDPASDRWVSRDVLAIAASRELPAVAPYFIDQEREPGQGGLPIAGLTVLSFSNDHLTYALTWSVLALMAAAGAILVNVETLRSRGAPGRPGRGRASSSWP